MFKVADNLPGTYFSGKYVLDILKEADKRAYSEYNQTIDALQKRIETTSEHVEIGMYLDLMTEARKTLEKRREMWKRILTKSL